MAYTFKHGDHPLEGYTVQRGVGRGGFGEVYYAISDGGREVALKYLRDNSEVELRGVSQCMNLKSPHLVTIFDVKKNADGEYFIIMEYISGPSLAEVLIAEPNGVGVEKAAFFVREIGKGLAYLHDRGIVHRDMKPANIFYEDGHVKIGDYGLSKFISVSRHSAQTTSVGTVHYMAPEVGSGNYHRGIDIYALGVMLYEMLLGKVPFEGSSMGEVLMKHLTEQPEVEGLPRPFGDVIRKALAKDPKDRYQNVNEMIDDILDVGEVRSSLAGFNPNTITALPRRHAADPMRTPVPSPNPMRPPIPPPDVGVPPPPRGFRVGELPRGVARRMDRISEKVNRRMDKLAGRPHRPRPRGGPNMAMVAMGNKLATYQRAVLAAIIMVGVAVALGLLTGAASDMPELGASAGMMVVAISLGVRGTTKATDWLGASAQPGWVQKLVCVGCCTPLMAIATAPVFADIGEPEGFTLLVGLLVAVLFASWDKRIAGGSRGELSFGNAFYLGVFGFITCWIATALFEGDDEFILTGAAVMAGVSVVVEALAWFLPPKGLSAPVGTEAKRESPPPGMRASGAEDNRREPYASPIPPPPRPPFGRAAHRARLDTREIPFGVAVEPGTAVSGVASTTPLRRPRSGFARGFFSIVAFIMLLGIVANIIFAVFINHDDDVLVGHIVGAGACLAFMMFSMSKLTLYKRSGFWRESFCPFLIAVVMTALCACITIVATLHLHDDELAGAIVGIVFSGLAFGALIASWVWPTSPRLARHGGPTMQSFICVPQRRGGSKPESPGEEVTDGGKGGRTIGDEKSEPGAPGFGFGVGDGKANV